MPVTSDYSKSPGTLLRRTSRLRVRSWLQERRTRLRQMMKDTWKPDVDNSVTQQTIVDGQ